MKKAFGIVALLGMTMVAASLAMSGQTKTSGERCCPLSACPRAAAEKVQCRTCTLPCKPCPDCTLCSPGLSRAL